MIQLDHIFDTSLISGYHGSLLDQKYVLPITGFQQVELLGFYPNFGVKCSPCPSLF